MLFAAAAMDASAEDYVLQASAKPEVATWSADGGVTTVATADVPDGSTFRVLNSMTLNTTESDYTMSGAVELGCVDDATYGTQAGGISRGADGSGVLSANFKWYHGRISTTTADSTMTIGGTIDVIGSEKHWFGCSSAPTRIELAADLCSDADDVNIVLGHEYTSSLTYDEVNDACPMGAMMLSGDNSGYRGTFTVFSRQVRRLLVLSGSHPLGSPDVAKTALTIADNQALVLALAANCSQSANRKIKFNSSLANYFGAWKDSGCDGFTLSYPITCGSSANVGKLIKVGDGTFRYNGAYAAREIAVSNGTFVVGSEATFPSGQAFIVGSGATLIVEPGAAANLTDPSVTLVDATATAEYGRQTVPFDGAVATPVELTAAQHSFAWVHPFALERPIALPVYTRQRIAVFTIPNGNMTEADFRDETPKTDGDKPQTGLVMEKDETTGTQTLYVVVEPALVKVTIPFDGTNATAATLTDWPAGLVQPFALAQSFDLPILETNRQAVLKIPGGTHTLADFLDETPATVCGLPQTWLELGSDDAGNQILYVVARPTLAATGVILTENVWSDGETAHAGADYYHLLGYGDTQSGDQRTTSGSWSNESLIFAGESYTLADSRTLRAYNLSLKFNLLRTFPGAKLMPNPGGMNRSLRQTWRGSWFVGGDADDWSTPVVFYTRDYLANVTIESSLSGAGAVKFYSAAVALADANDHVTFYLYGDNRDFIGQLVLEEQTYAKSFVEVAVTNAAAFGGALASAMPDAVKICPESSKVTAQTNRMVVSATASMTVNAANRGWTTTCGCGFRQAEGVIFTFAPPTFSMGGEIRKDGAGTLALAYDELVASGEAKLTIAEGAVSQLKEGCLNGVAVEFAGGGVCVDANATEGAKSSGLAPASIALADGITSVPVTFANVTKGQSPLAFSQAVLTAPSGTAALNLVPVRPRGYDVTITSASGGDGTTIYTANLKCRGFSVIIR